MTGPQNVLMDAPDRERMEMDLGRNVVLLAGAGAGKTHALITRMVGTVEAGYETVDHLAAITFTHKAAGEMRGRFHAALRDRLNKAEGVCLGRIREALAGIDACFIGTIHAFCARLLRERPLEAGLDPGFRELTEHQEAVLRRENWDRFIRQAYESADPRLLRLPEFGLRAEDLYSFYTLRLRYPELPLRPVDVEPPDLQQGLDACIAFINEFLPHLPQNPTARPDSVQEALDRSHRLLAFSPPETDADRVRFITLWQSAGKVTLNRWPDKDLARDIRDRRIPSLHDTLAPIVTQWRQVVYGQVKDLADEAASTFAETCRSSAAVTFQQLLTRAAQLLRRSPDVRRGFQNRSRILFVDEFQDTDPVQAEILFLLCGDDPSETDWRRARPRPGSLIIVGDAKQSIYRFRRADVEIFQHVGRSVEEAGGQTLRLTSSFRSTGALCKWLNEALEPVLRQDEPPFQADFEPLHQVRPPGPDEFGVRRITIAKTAGNNRATVAARDADRIANFISAAARGKTEFNGPDPDSLLDATADPGDFLVLTRTRTCLQEYARALEARGIAYDIVGAGAVKESQELRAVLQLLEAVIIGDNPVPVVGVLRGPLVGLGDDELYAYSKAGGRFDFRRRLPDDLPESLRESITQGFKMALAADRFIRAHTPSVAFERILEELGLIPYAASGSMGSSRASALLRAVALVRQWEGSGLSWVEILQEMRAVLDNPEYVVEDMTLESGREDVVRLMVVHQAKGLQAKVVFLADPADTSSGRHRIDAHVSRVGESAFLSAPVVRRTGDYSQETLAEPPDWADAEAREKRFQEAEEKRLLYVAATRACNLLVISRYGGAPDKGPWSALEPALQNVAELPDLPAHFPYRPGSPGIDVKRSRRLRTERLERVREQTHQLETVTGSRREFEPEHTRRGGYGREYGILVHKLFEAAVNRTLPENREAFVQARVDDRGADPRMKRQALNALNAFERSTHWAELREAPRCFTEVPFVGSEKRNGTPTVLRGTLDLLYRVEGGWKLVDYKTDRARDDDTVDALLDRYADQVRTYALQWETIAGEPVVEKGIWLTDGSRWLVV